MMLRTAGLACLLLLLAITPLIAHHSFAAQYDEKKPVDLKLAVTKVEWMNPHVWIYGELKDSNGKVVKWECEASNPNMLARRGLKRDFLKAGEQVTIQGFRAKNGTQVMSVTWILWPDGRKVFAGSAVPGEGPSSYSVKPL
jgi:hypothetical protein